MHSPIVLDDPRGSELRVVCSGTFLHFLDMKRVVARARSHDSALFQGSPIVLSDARLLSRPVRSLGSARAAGTIAERGRPGAPQRAQERGRAAEGAGGAPGRLGDADVVAGFQSEKRGLPRARTPSTETSACEPDDGARPGLPQGQAGPGAGHHTTAMIRNLPCRLTQNDICSVLDESGLRGTYDVVFAPRRGPRGKSRDCNMGYAFVNFVDAEFLAECGRLFNNRKFGNCQSCTKVCEVTLAHIQGREALVDCQRKAKHGPLVLQPERSIVGHALGYLGQASLLHDITSR